MTHILEVLVAVNNQFIDLFRGDMYYFCHISTGDKHVSGIRDRKN